MSAALAMGILFLFGVLQLPFDLRSDDGGWHWPAIGLSALTHLAQYFPATLTAAVLSMAYMRAAGPPSAEDA